ncbi:MAG: hypothetical protein ABIQ32_06635 [Sphingomicrobium sp.]
MAQPAYAHWQYTKWGMTPAQVLKASGGRAAIVDQGSVSDADVRNRGPYVSGDYEFTATYHYKNDSLTSVSLELNGACRALKGDLLALYGDKYETINVPGLAQTYFWKDYKKGNAVSFLTFGSHCNLTYSQIDTKTRHGL